LDITVESAIAAGCCEGRVREFAALVGRTSATPHELMALAHE